MKNIFDVQTRKIKLKLKVVLCGTTALLARKCKDDFLDFYSHQLANFFIDKIAT